MELVPFIAMARSSFDSKSSAEDRAIDARGQHGGGSQVWTFHMSKLWTLVCPPPPFLFTDSARRGVKESLKAARSARPDVRPDGPRPLLDPGGLPQGRALRGAARGAVVGSGRWAPGGRGATASSVVRRGRHRGRVRVTSVQPVIE